MTYQKKQTINSRTSNYDSNKISVTYRTESGNKSYRSLSDYQIPSLRNQEAAPNQYQYQQHSKQCGDLDIDTIEDCDDDMLSENDDIQLQRMSIDAKVDLPR